MTEGTAVRVGTAIVAEDSCSAAGRPRQTHLSSLRGTRYILIAISLVRVILCQVSRGPFHFERRKAVESSLKGPPATFPKHKTVGQNFWHLL